MRAFSDLQLKSITFNSFFQFLVRITTSTSTLIATILIAYFSGYETLGSFTKIVAFVSIFYLLLDFGINSIFLKQHFEKANKHLGNLVTLRLTIAILFLPIIALLAFLLPQTLNGGFTSFEKYGIVVFSLTLIPTALHLSLQTILQKNLKYSLSLLPSLLSSLVLITLIFYSLFASNFQFLLFSYYISGIILILSLYFIVKKHFQVSLILNNVVPFSRNLLISSLPLGTILFVNLLYSKVDTFMLAYYQTTYDVGVYGVSYRFFELAIAIPAFLSNSAYPLLLKHHTTPSSYLPIFRKYLGLFIFVGIIIAILLFSLTPLIRLLKREFIQAVPPLQILSLSLPFFFATSILQWHFLIKGKIKFLLPVYIGALVLNIILNMIFIPKFSYNAAAATTLLSEGLVFLIMIWYFLLTKKN